VVKRRYEMRKFWIVLVVLGLVLCVTGCKQGAKEAKEAPEAQVEEEAEIKEAPAKEVTSGKMTDDIWVEIFAYSQYRTGKYGAELEKAKTIVGKTQIGEKYAEDMENIYKKF
jgi:hypothetical protein